MDKRKRIFIVAGVVGAAALLFMMYRRDSGGVAQAMAPLQDPFTAPYYTDGKQPGAGFQSNINVSINPDAWAGLANQYMPVFGFVGVGVTGSLPSSIINVNTITNNVPPQRVVQQANTVAAAPKPPAPTWNMVPSHTSTRPSGFGSR